MSTTEILTTTPPPRGPDADDDWYEIVDGTRIEIPPMSAESSVLAARLSQRITAFAQPANLGEAYPEILFKLPLARDRNRKPDIAFVPYSRWPKTRAIPPTNAWSVLPDLCVEVVSPSDLAEENRTKVEEYLEAGVRLVWVVYPRRQLVDVFTSPDAIRVVRRDGELDGGIVLPGFRLKLADLFPEPEPEPPAAPSV